MNQIPERLILQATLNGDPVEGVMLRAGFGVTSKNSYSFYFGPTNHDGCAVLTRDEIIEQATNEMKFALMDYNPIEGVFDGNICYKALNLDDIERAISAYDRFHEYTPYPHGYREKMEQALSNSMTEKTSDIKVTWLK